MSKIFSFIFIPSYYTVFSKLFNTVNLASFLLLVFFSLGGGGCLQPSSLNCFEGKIIQAMQMLIVLFNMVVSIIYIITSIRFIINVADILNNLIMIFLLLKISKYTIKKKYTCTRQQKHASQQ